MLSAEIILLNRNNYLPKFFIVYIVVIGAPLILFNEIILFNSFEKKNTTPQLVLISAKLSIISIFKPCKRNVNLYFVSEYKKYQNP